MHQAVATGSVTCISKEGAVPDAAQLRDDAAGSPSGGGAADGDDAGPSKAGAQGVAELSMAGVDDAGDGSDSAADDGAGADGGGVGVVGELDDYGGLEDDGLEQGPAQAVQQQHSRQLQRQHAHGDGGGRSPVPPKRRRLQRLVSSYSSSEGEVVGDGPECLDVDCV